MDLGYGERWVRTGPGARLDRREPSLGISLGK